MLLGFRGRKPKIHKTAFVHPTATVIGKVSVGEHSSIWPGAVVRGDFASVRIGRYVCIQDNAVIHPGDVYGRKGVKYLSVKIGDHVIVGHNALLHGCTVENNCIIGGGSVIFDGARVQEGSLIGLGAVILKKARIPPRTVMVGIPARPLRELTDEEFERIGMQAENYAKLAKEYMRFDSSVS
jgi:carbonic anhydrase/acetyltransferase-like protein (isoleucine patch superfamily)